jgi:hypothetical protein
VKVLLGMSLSVILVSGGAIGGWVIRGHVDSAVSSIPLVGAWIK